MGGRAGAASMLVIGIDEAGYGPLLGPLVVAGSAFRVGEGEPEPGAALRAALDGPAPRRSGIRVGDSKVLFGRGGLAALETPVLASLRASGVPFPDDLDGLLGAVAVDPRERRALPWYAGDLASFPLRSLREDVEPVAEALGARLAERDARFVGFAAEVVAEDRLNRLFAKSGNKATTLFDLSAAVFRRLLAHASPGEQVAAVFDRQGGRKNYLPPLQSSFPDAFVWRMGEGPHRSAYRLDVNQHGVAASFVVRGDAEHPQVGLASLLAKYLREAFMSLWNDWFHALCPDVRPTAGYTEDGRRWLTESRTPRTAAGIPDEVLIRTR